jgi:hypothetical protein
MMRIDISWTLPSLFLLVLSLSVVMPTCGRGCAAGWDVRVCCEVNCPVKNTMEEFGNCARAIFTAEFTVNNSFELHNNGTMTRAEYAEFITPTLMEWFSAVNEYTQARKVNETLALLLDDEVEFLYASK